MNARNKTNAPALCACGTVLDDSRALGCGYCMKTQNADRSRLDEMRAKFEREYANAKPGAQRDAAWDILALLDSAEQNANDTIFAEHAAPVADWPSLFVGTLRSELSCGDWSRGAVEWFASQGVTA